MFKVDYKGFYAAEELAVSTKNLKRRLRYLCRHPAQLKSRSHLWEEVALIKERLTEEECAEVKRGLYKTLYTPGGVTHKTEHELGIEENAQELSDLKNLLKPERKMNKTAKNVELMRTDYQVVNVIYGANHSEGYLKDTAAENSVESFYSYKTTEVFERGDILLLPANHSFSLGTVISMADASELYDKDNINFKWVVGKVDFTTYKANQRIDKELAQAIYKAERENKRQQALTALQESLGEETFKALTEDASKLPEKEAQQDA